MRDTCHENIVHSLRILSAPLLSKNFFYMSFFNIQYHMVSKSKWNSIHKPHFRRKGVCHFFYYPEPTRIPSIKSGMETDIKSKLGFICIVAHKSRSSICLAISPFQYFGRYASTRFLDLFYSLTTTSNLDRQSTIQLTSLCHRSCSYVC
jgi:hypothetical protein